MNSAVTKQTGKFVAVAKGPIFVPRPNIVMHVPMLQTYAQPPS